jgi:hypothetical protein
MSGFLNTKNYYNYFNNQKNYNTSIRLDVELSSKESQKILEGYKLLSSRNKVNVVSSLIKIIFRKGVFNVKIDFCYMCFENIIKFESNHSIIIQGIIISELISKDLLCYINRIKSINYFDIGIFSNCNIFDVLCINIEKDLYPFDIDNVLHSLLYILSTCRYKESEFFNYKFIIVEQYLIHEKGVYSEYFEKIFNKLQEVTLDDKDLDFYKGVVKMYKDFENNNFVNLKNFENTAIQYCGSSDVLYYFTDRFQKYFLSYVRTSESLYNIATNISSHILESIYYPELQLDNEYNGYYVCKSLERLDNDSYRKVISNIMLTYKCPSDYEKMDIFDQVKKETDKKIIEMSSVFPVEISRKIYFLLK